MPASSFELRASSFERGKRGGAGARPALGNGGGGDDDIGGNQSPGALWAQGNVLQQVIGTWDHAPSSKPQAFILQSSDDGCSWPLARPSPIPDFEIRGVVMGARAADT